MSIRMILAFLLGVSATASLWAVWGSVASTDTESERSVVAHRSEVQRNGNAFRRTQARRVVETPRVGKITREASEPPASKVSEQDERELHRLRAELSKVRRRKAELVEEQELLQDRVRRAERRAGIDQKRHPFELSKEDWLQLAKEGTMQFRVPCEVASDWQLRQQELIELGLTRADFESVHATYQRSNARIWEALRPACVRALGSEEAAQAMGMRNCWHLVLGSGDKRPVARLVAEVKAGVVELPEEPTDVERLYLALAAESERFEADLAEAFGPDEAHRLHYSQGLCFVESRYRGKPSVGPYDQREE